MKPSKLFWNLIFQFQFNVGEKSISDFGVAFGSFDGIEVCE